MFVLAEEFPTNHVTIFRHDPHQPVVVLGMIPHQLGQPLHLPFQPFQAPHDLHHGIGSLDSGLDDCRLSIVFFHVRSLNESDRMSGRWIDS
jgi:hypothetical protein